jgi:signal transduction histidine kinase
MRERSLMNLDSTLRSQPKAVIVALAILLVVAVTWNDYVMGWEISLGVFYAFPILLVVWYLGRTAGIGMALLCMVAWWWANKVGNPYATRAGYIWATISRLVYFIFIAIAGAAVRKQRDSDRAHIAALEHARALERDIVNVSEHEQRRIGQDLHDGLCQVLAGIGCAISMLKDELRAKSLPEADAAEEIEGFVRDAATEARDLARGIFPVLQDAVGLESALEELAALCSRLHHRQISLANDDGIVFAKPDMAMHVYRIAQEALSNALKHAKAQNVTLSLRKIDGGVIRLTIEDDGHGMPAPPRSFSGMGLRTMRYRAALINASLEIGSRPNGGTVVTCDMRPDTLVHANRD